VVLASVGSFVVIVRIGKCPLTSSGHLAGARNGTSRLSALSERTSGTASDMVKASRRSWSREEKRRIVEEASRPGTSVADVARRHGLNSNQVFNWRKLWGTQPAADAGCPAVPRAQPDASPDYVPEGFLSIGVITETKDIGAIPRPDPSTLLVAPQDRGTEARPAMDERPGMIEIDLPGGTRLRVDSFVNERALRRVLSVLQAL
jgi:transposase